MDSIDLATPFIKDCPEPRALLYYFFLDCGGVSKLALDNDFCEILREAFRRYVSGEGTKAESLRRNENTPKYICSFLETLVKDSLGIDARHLYEFGNITLDGNAMPIGSAVLANIPVHTMNAPNTANEINCYYASGFRHICLARGDFNVTEMRLVEPFCDLNANMKTQIAIAHLKALDGAFHEHMAKLYAAKVAEWNKLSKSITALNYSITELKTADSSQRRLNLRRGILSWQLQTSDSRRRTVNTVQ
ncbi:hypothetical protein EJ02DRAFT_427677 [Clathrospora elynae]|uniref:Uncharacterized protein n=1 Tax=Clathrospora elynae TaxID=706981 RepID=A0A6A5S9U7_9PLEO|nr:hypothetical protein EJ02DRAFT_427677 [Clathrospora elynae]